MNWKEFGALKPGDKVENLMNGSAGVVSAETAYGVKVQWGISTMEYIYTVNSTAWMHWSKAEPAMSPELDKALDAFVADKPADIAGPA